jgi:hypothetical protein
MIEFDSWVTEPAAPEIAGLVKEKRRRSRAPTDTAYRKPTKEMADIELSLAIDEIVRSFVRGIEESYHQAETQILKPPPKKKPDRDAEKAAPDMKKQTGKDLAQERAKKAAKARARHDQVIEQLNKAADAEAFAGKRARLLAEHLDRIVIGAEAKVHAADADYAAAEMAARLLPLAQKMCSIARIALAYPGEAISRARRVANAAGDLS